MKIKHRDSHGSNLPMQGKTGRTLPEVEAYHHAMWKTAFKLRILTMAVSNIMVRRR